MLLGLLLGLGRMAQCAAICVGLGICLGALLRPTARIWWRDAFIAAGVFLAVISPNIIWNLQNDLTTLSHTANNVDWVRQDTISLNVSSAVEFLLSQFGVFGPVIFAAYLVALVLAVRSGSWLDRWLVVLSAPILLLVTIQALLSRAYANWAVTACVGILLLAVPYLWPRLRWLFWAGLIFNLSLTAAIPIAATQATEWRMQKDGRLVLRRFVGRSEMSHHAIRLAEQHGLEDILADDRDMLADLIYTARSAELNVFAQPHGDHPPHYLARTLRYPQGRTGPVVYLGTAAVPPCPSTLIDTHIAGPGAYAGRTVQFFIAPSDCWDTLVTEKDSP